VALTVDQRRLLVQLLRGLSLAILVVGFLFGTLAFIQLQGTSRSPSEDLQTLEARERTGSLSRFPGETEELAHLRALRDAGQLSTRRPLTLDAPGAFLMFGGPILLLGGFVWWIGSFLRAGGSK
jgi:hypothetical protein